MKDSHKILLLSSAILLSFSYIYDLPATLNEHIKYNNINKADKLAMLYSVYALPNIIIPLFFRWTNSVDWPSISEVLCFLVLIGQVFYSIGVYRLSFKLMVVGRFIYGIGAESFSVLINRLLSKEFKGNRLAFTLGIVSSISRFGSILNFMSSPLLADKLHRFLPCAIGIIMTTGSLFACFVLNKILKAQRLSNYMLVENKETLKPFKTIKYEDIVKTKTEENATVLDYSEIFYSVDFNESPFTPWESVTKNYSNEMTKQSENVENKQLENEENTIFYEPSIQKSNGTHSTFYLLAAISFLIALVWAPFYSLAPIIFDLQYNIKSVETGYLLSIIDLFGLFSTPFVGLIADKYGNKMYFVMLGCLILLLAHGSLTLHLLSPYLIMSILGIAGPLINCYWPCIPTLVSERNLTNGFALIFCLLNLAFTISPYLMGFIMTKTQSYECVEFFIVAISCVAMLVTGFLIHLNVRFNLGLNNKSESDQFNK